MNLKPWINFMSPGFCSVLVILLKLEMMENEEINFHNQSVESKHRFFGPKYHNNKKYLLSVGNHQKQIHYKHKQKFQIYLKILYTHYCIAFLHVKFTHQFLF